MSGLATQTPAFSDRRLVLLFATPAPAFLATARDLVHGRPRSALGFVFADTPLFVAFLDMLRLAFLLLRVRSLASSRHVTLLE